MKKDEKINGVEFRLELFQTRSKLQKKAISKPVKEMIQNGLWEKTNNDNNFLAGRIISAEFLKTLKKLEHSIE